MRQILSNFLSLFLVVSWGLNFFLCCFLNTDWSWIFFRAAAKCHFTVGLWVTVYHLWVIFFHNELVSKKNRSWLLWVRASLCPSSFCCASFFSPTGPCHFTLGFHPTTCFRAADSLNIQSSPLKHHTTKLSREGLTAQSFTLIFGKKN